MNIIRDKVKNKLPNLTILLILLCVKLPLNNSLFKKNLTRSKGNRMTKLGRIFFVLRLTPIAMA